MQAAHYLKSLTEVPVRDAPSAAAPHLYAISNGLAVFALSKRMVREDGQLSAWFELAAEIKCDLVTFTGCFWLLWQQVKLTRSSRSS